MKTSEKGGGKVFGHDLFLEWLFIYNLITLRVIVDNLKIIDG